jgi:hypothetical protein
MPQHQPQQGCHLANAGLMVSTLGLSDSRAPCREYPVASVAAPCRGVSGRQRGVLPEFAEIV